jgi:hypothetical protein
MNSTTKTTIELTKTLAKAGFRIPAIEIHTPDGRCWNIATVPAGRGRLATGAWGPRPGSPGGFRLFEIDRENEDAPNEHDAIDGDTWTASELLDYLRAVGQPKDTTSWDRKNDNHPTT